jgi:iron complex outermembrane receptor protein
MNRLSRRTARIALMTASAGAIAVWTPALAQEAIAGAAQDQADAAKGSPKQGDKDDAGQDIVVTGTRIAGVVPASPVTVISREDIERKGYSGLSDVLRELPQNFGGGQYDSTAGATGSLNGGNVTASQGVNLRGLGSDATLVLLNGRRLAVAGTRNSVDLSSIPLSAVERVDVLTDGASAIYGSDAVAGVVNIITKRDYDGAESLGELSALTRGGGAKLRVGQSLGLDWRGGGLFGTVEYYNQDGLYASEREFSARIIAPTSLMPSIRRVSGLVSGHQSLSDALTLSIDGLYTDREANSRQTTATQLIEMAQTAKQYVVNGELALAAAGGWSGALSGSFAQDDATQDIAILNRTTLARTPSITTYRNDVATAELSASGPLFAIGGNSVKIALGGGYRRETLVRRTPTSPAVTGSTNGQRDVGYAYGEVIIPFATPADGIDGIHEFSLSASGRYEHFSDFGGNFSPKAGVVYAPIAGLRLKGTIGRSFHAPALTTLFGFRQVSLQSLPDPASTTGSSLALVRAGGNADLGPERSTSKTATIEFEPAFAPRLRVSASYFDIDYTGRILQPISVNATALTNPAFQSAISRTFSAADAQALVSSADLFSNFTTGTFNPALVRVIVNNANQNLASYSTRGFDLAASYAIPTRSGAISISGNLTRILELETRLTGNAPVIALADTLFNPAATKASGTLSWQTGGFTATTSVHHVGSYTDNVTVPNYRIDSWTTVDAQLSYIFASDARVLNGLRVSLSATNLFDESPPLVAATSFVTTPSGYDSTNANPLGRVLTLRIIKQW